MSNIDDLLSFDALEINLFSEHPEEIAQYKKGLIEDYNEEEEIKLEHLFAAFKHIMEIELIIKGFKDKLPVSTVDVLKEIDKTTKLLIPKVQTNAQEEIETVVAASAC
jgi:hypothetical protein